MSNKIVLEGTTLRSVALLAIFATLLHLSGSQTVQNVGIRDDGPRSKVVVEHNPSEIVEKRDDHTRIWEVRREIELVRPGGEKRVDGQNSYIVEKASGLCYRDSQGNFVPSAPEWRETAEGFVTNRCPHSLFVGNTLDSWMAYETGGRQAFLRPFSMMASDGKIEASLAMVNPEARGFVPADSPSTLRFADAFGEGLHLEIVAEKAGFHQNLILTNQPEIPEQLGLQDTRIYIYTEVNLDDYARDQGYGIRVGTKTVDLTSSLLLTEPTWVMQAMPGPMVTAWRLA